MIAVRIVKIQNFGLLESIRQDTQTIEGTNEINKIDNQDRDTDREKERERERGET